MQDIDFIKEQYAQYHQTRRQLNGFSWQLPSIAVLAILFFPSFDEQKLKVWFSNPEIPAIGFLFLSMFLFVLLIFHIRNITILRNFEKILSEFEKEYGIPASAYANELEYNLKFWQKIRSSTLLGFFIGVLSCFSLVMSVYYFIKFIC